MGARERERGLPILDKVLVSICYAEPHLGKKNKPLGVAFYPLLAIAGGKSGALWPGDATEAPEEGHLLPALGSLEQTGFLGRGLTDYSTTK